MKFQSLVVATMLYASNSVSGDSRHDNICKSSIFARGKCYSISEMENAAEEAYKNFPKAFGTHTDDAMFTVMTGSGPYDGGDALRIEYLSGGGKDDDNLGSLAKGSVESFREDLSGSPLEIVSLNMKGNDDACIRAFILTAGKEVSGTNERKSLIVPAFVIADVTKITLQQDCIWFGDEQNSLGDFTFRWKPALECFDRHYQNSAHDYAVCLAQSAMIRFDIKNGAKYERVTQSLW